MQENNEKKLSGKVRVFIGIFAIPSLLLATMLVSLVIDGNYNEISAFELIYSVVGFVAAYIAVSGKKLF